MWMLPYEQFEHVGGEYDRIIDKAGVLTYLVIKLAKYNGLCWKMSLNMSNVEYEFIGELHWISQPHEIVSNQFK